MKMMVGSDEPDDTETSAHASSKQEETPPWCVYHFKDNHVTDTVPVFFEREKFVFMRKKMC